MASETIGRRKFLTRLSAAILGTAASPLWKVGPSGATPGKTPPLEYRSLGRTGLKVTAVSMGVMNCSDSSVLLRAYDLGINFYDTADCYMGGRNEEMVGKVFRGKRDKVFIQTKVHDHKDEKKMRASVERSLRRLQTDYVDILVWHGFHSPEEVSNPAFQEFMAKMKKEGKARFTGFSSHSRMAPLLREAAKLNYHDVALVSYNFTHSKELKEAVALAANGGIGVVAMKTQSGGYKKEKMGGLTPHQAALRYILQDANVAATVPGVTTVEQIEECAAAMRTSLSKEDMSHLRQYQAFLQGRVCTMCGGCPGECPYGVAYRDVLRVAMYHDGYESQALVREVMQGRDILGGIRQCSDCSSCLAVCRRGLDIQAQVKRVQNLLT